MVKPITEVDAKKVVDKFLVLSNQKIEKFQYKIGSEQHQIALSEIKFLSSRARKVTLHGKENEDLLVFSNRSMYMNLLIGKDTPNFAMVKKTPKMFFRFNGEDMPLTTIYNKNKKRRGRSRYQLSVQIDVVKDGKRWDIEVFFKVCKSYLNLSKECRSISYDAIPALLKSKLQAA